MTDPEHYALAMRGEPAPGHSVPPAELRPGVARAAAAPDEDALAPTRPSALFTPGSGTPGAP
ncbi:hypothetical protein [Streptomyces sp. 3N207]|uniref:hypothetical protein n=1 Tax=Streptomyces sp. 3N207 TaxID=3457417 RepID=UPI003FD63A1E